MKKLPTYIIALFNEYFGSTMSMGVVAINNKNSTLREGYMKIGDIHTHY